MGQGGGVNESITTGENLATEFIVAQPGSSSLEWSLLQRSRGETQIHGLTVGVPEPIECVAEHPVESGSKRWFGETYAGQLEADRCRDGGLMGATLIRQGGSGGGTGDDETRSGIHGVDKRVETSTDEGVVDGADRQQGLTVEVGGEAKHPEENEQVHLADAKLDVLTGWPLNPSEQVAGTQILLRLRREHADLVDPSAEVGGHGDVWCCGHHAFGHLGHPAQVDENLAERFLRRRRLRSGRTGQYFGLRGHARPGAVQHLLFSRNGDARSVAQRLLGRAGGETIPFVCIGKSQRRAELLDLLFCHQCCVVQRIAGHRESVALDRVGKDHGRSVGHCVCGTIRT